MAGISELNEDSCARAGSEDSVVDEKRKRFERMRRMGTSTDSDRQGSGSDLSRLVTPILEVES